MESLRITDYGLRLVSQVVVMGFLAAFPLTPQSISFRAYRWALLGSVAASLIAIGQQRGVRPTIPYRRSYLFKLAKGTDD